MLTLIETSFNRAEEAFVNNDQALCDSIIVSDEAINNKEVVIDNLAMDILLKYKPVASDLRFVVSSISIAKSIERLGDHLCRIAKQIKKLDKSVLMAPDVEYIKDLFSLAKEQLAHTKEAILTHDASEAGECLDGEERAKETSKQISAIFVNLMSQDNEGIPNYLSLIFIARSIQRFSKLCTNIAEDIIYIETSKPNQ